MDLLPLILFCQYPVLTTIDRQSLHHVYNNASHDREDDIGKGIRCGKTEGGRGTPGIVLESGQGRRCDPGTRQCAKEQDRVHPEEEFPEQDTNHNRCQGNKDTGCDDIEAAGLQDGDCLFSRCQRDVTWSRINGQTVKPLFSVGAFPQTLLG